MENQTNSKSVILNYGLYTGVLSILIALILFALGKSADPGVLLALVSFVAPLVLLILGIKKFKEANQGFMTWGQGVKIGVGIALVWGVLALGFQFLLENVISPELIDLKLQVARTQMENFGMSEDVIEAQMEKSKNQSPFFGFALGLIFFTIIGFVVSAITAAVMKNAKEENY